MKIKYPMGMIICIMLIIVLILVGPIIDTGLELQNAWWITNGFMTSVIIVEIIIGFVLFVFTILIGFMWSEAK